MTLPYLLSVLIFLPIACGAFLLFFADDDHPGLSRGTAVSVGIANFLLSLALLTGGSFQEKFPWIEPLGITYFLRVDGLSLWLILLVTFLTPIAAAASWNLIREKAKVYYGCMMLLSGGMVGLLCAMDLFLFYVFWEVMLIPAFFLVGIYGGAKRAEATTKFVIYTMVGSLLMLVAIVYTGFRFFQTTGVWSFNLLDLYGLTYPAGSVADAVFATGGHWAFAAFVLAFCIKAAMFPLHTWAPDTYTQAPAPVTFLLSAVMSKMGIYGLLRVANPLFPDAARDFAPVLIALAVIGIVYAGLIALVQDDVKRLLAYASVSHLGVILLGVFTTSQQALSGAVLYMVAHAISTGALFLLVGFLYERRGTTQISAFGGLTAAIPVYSTFFMVVMLASVGLPGLAGFIGEFLIFLGAFGSHAVATTIATTTIITGAGYMLWMFQRTMFGPLTDEGNRKLSDLSVREGWLLAPILALIIAIGVYPQMMLSRINPAVTDYLALMNVKQAAPVGHQVSAPQASEGAAPQPAHEVAEGAAGGIH